MPPSLQSLFRGRQGSLLTLTTAGPREKPVASDWLPGFAIYASPVGRQIARITMSNPVVFITGGLSGIGRAAAVAFAKKGAKVVVAGRRDEAGKTLVKELRS